jgi:hypothetical protein
MGITTGASISSYAFGETSLPSQTDQTGNNTVITTDGIDDTVNASPGNGGQVTGTDFVGRLIVIRLGTETEETRLVTADVASTGNTRKLTVSEDWDTVPASGDSFYAFYNMNDLENVTSEYNTRTGFYEMTNPIIVGNGTALGGLFIGNGELVEVEDSKSATVYHLEIQNNGRLQVGYLRGGKPIAGAYLTGINNTQGEAWINFEAGSEGRLYDVRFIAGLNPLAFVISDGTNDIKADNFSIFQGTDEGEFLDSEWKNGSITGSNTTTEIIRVDAGTTMDNVTFINIDTVTHKTAGTETIELRNCSWVGTNDYIDLDDDKTWNIVNPTWGATTNSDFEDTAVAGTATINDQRSIDVVVQKADGTKLQSALINIYENTQLDDLVLETTTDSNGIASGVFNYIVHSWTTGTGSTTTYGGHALQCGKWLYLPFVATQVSTDLFDGTIVLSPDNNIVQTTQATAKTDGSGITWNEDTNPSELIDFTTGSGTLAVGMVLTFSPSGAVGTITQSLDGDSTSGTIHLDTRNSTAIANGDTFSRTGGTAGTFSGTYTNSTSQEFSIHIDGNSKSFQTIYDYLSAIQTETTLTADGEKIWEWCRAAQTQPLYTTGSSFYTEQSNSKGIIIINGGGGTVDYYTDDTGTTWVPPTTVTVQITVKDITGTEIQNAQVGVFATSDGSAVTPTADTNASGVYSQSYTGTTPIEVKVWVRKASAGATKYKNYSSIQNITASGLTLDVTMVEDPNNNATT